VSAPAGYDLLAGPIQQSLWRMGWTELRTVQADAIQAILLSDDDVLISAPTASGKTEAAFLPILSQLCESPTNSVGALYVGPLKALINDQFRRLEELCAHADIPVHRWHGDVGVGAKKRLIERPGGVLLITPESLESTFVNRTAQIKRTFGQLRFVVIDELHALVGRERGLHLRSLLFRLRQRIGAPFRLIGLSATLGDWADTYAAWLRPGELNQVRVITEQSGDKSIRFKIYGYSEEPDVETTRPLVDDNDRQDEYRPPDAVLDEMLAAFGGKKCLIFANRRTDVEKFADLLNERSENLGRPKEFLVHHGSLSKDIREHTEAAMRERRPCSIVCSSTLELGIDVGSVAAVGQLGAPWSVTSMVQRLGRSGRRDETTAEMRLFVGEEPIQPEADITVRLHLELLQAIALTELMLEKWIEPPEIDALDLSTLVQQVLSVVKEMGGIEAAMVFERLVEKGAFRCVDVSKFKAVLRCLGEHDLLEQDPTGGLILGIEGEHVVRRYDFYSAFTTPLEFRVVYQQRLIGMLPHTAVPQPGDCFLLAARRWEVIEIDENREEVSVVPARGRKVTLFTGERGNLHTRVRQTMRRILFGHSEPAYLNHQAAGWLKDARKTAREADLQGSSWFSPTDSKCYWFTWTGTQAHETLKLMAHLAGTPAEDMAGIALLFRAAPADIMRMFKSVMDRQPTAFELAAQLPQKQKRKYDRYLSDELLIQDRATDAIDVQGAMELLQQMST